MAKPKNKLQATMPIWMSLLGLGALGILTWLLMRGNDVVLFNPKGYVANQQMRLFIIATALLLEICIPTLVVLYYVAWKYREGNEKATYDPHAKAGKPLLIFMWGVPVITMVLFTAMLIPATHKLEPQKALAAGGKPMTIQVVALRWKWLFIYPEQNVATVNYVRIPIGKPVQFELTGDEVPMSSFWIPHLAGQLYAMTGHVNRLNLVGDTVGEYQGSVAEINGSGFAGMRFKTDVTTQPEFDAWLLQTRQSPLTLNEQQYKQLLVPTENNTPEYFSSTDEALFGSILSKNSGSHGTHAHTEAE